MSEPQTETAQPRYLAWFSAGAASAVATKLALTMYDDVTIYRTDVGSEHPDNERFANECAEWFGRDVHTIKVEKYADTWQVWEERRFLVGPKGALCTTELKKKARWLVERDYDFQVFGYTADPSDARRADRFRAQNPDVRLLTPLIDRGLTKSDCLAMIDRAGIELPAMYRLGYRNNNCIGCVKGGMGYWNKIRRDFPETFDRMAQLERRLDHTVIHDDDGPVFLDVLDPDRGDYATEADHQPSPPCSVPAATFEARYPGRCGVCDEGIRVGQIVTYVDDELAHVDCPTPVATAEPCTTCWTIPATNGACACEE